MMRSLSQAGSVKLKERGLWNQLANIRLLEVGAFGSGATEKPETLGSTSGCFNSICMFYKPALKFLNQVIWLCFNSYIVISCQKA